MANAEKATFPMDFTSPTRGNQTGLTKREYFAGLALQGILASKITDAQDVAKKAIVYAEALLKELEGQ